jgi:hypothetical protein
MPQAQYEEDSSGNSEKSRILESAGHLHLPEFDSLPATAGLSNLQAFQLSIRHALALLPALSSQRRDGRTDWEIRNVFRHAEHLTSNVPWSRQSPTPACSSSRPDFRSLFSALRFSSRPLGPSRFTRRIFGSPPRRRSWLTRRRSRVRTITGKRDTGAHYFPITSDLQNASSTCAVAAAPREKRMDGHRKLQSDIPRPYCLHPDLRVLHKA